MTKHSKKFNFILEGRIKLKDYERKQVDEILPKIIEVIKGPTIEKTKYEFIDEIHFEYADSTEDNPKIGIARVYVGNDNPNSSAYYNTLDPKDIRDNIIVFQQTPLVRGYFRPNLDQTVRSKLTGQNIDSIGVLEVKNTFIHELVHAKDPSINHHWTPAIHKGYDPEDNSKYYGSKIELDAMSTTIYEFIETEIDKVLKEELNPVELRRVLKILKDILLVFSGREKDFTPETYDFFDKTKQNRSFIKKSFMYIDKLTDAFGIHSTLKRHRGFIDSIKQANKENYNHFLKNLYKVIVECKEKVEKQLEVVDRYTKDGKIKFDLD